MTICVSCGKIIKDGIPFLSRDILSIRVSRHFNHECDDNDKQTHCPKCGYPQCCGCNDFCLAKIPEGIKPYTWDEEGECIICPNCGFTANADFWLTLEGFIFDMTRTEDA
jgi:hypothetical protein